MADQAGGDEEMGSWRLVSLIVGTIQVPVDEDVPAGMMRTRSGRWVHREEAEEGAEDDRWLTALEDWISDNLDLLVRSRHYGIALRLGWTPRAGQDGMALDARLISLMSTIGAELFIDVYP